MPDVLSKRHYPSFVDEMYKVQGRFLAITTDELEPTFAELSTAAALQARRSQFEPQRRWCIRGRFPRSAVVVRIDATHASPMMRLVVAEERLMAVITISRGLMSGGESLAQSLATELGYPCVGGDILIEAAAKLGVSKETLHKKFEVGPGLWGRLTSDRRLYVIAVQAALANHSRSGDLVYHGHAGHLLLKGIPNVLRVRLIAPLEMRVRAVMERQHLGHDAAVEYIRAMDEERIRWTKFLYGVDWRDPSLYDLVINLENMSIKTACAVVSHTVLQPEFAMTEATRRRLMDFHLACQVKLALARNPQTRGIEFEVQADDGIVDVFWEMPAAGMLAGTSHQGEEEIHMTVSGVEGVKTVRVHNADAYH